MKVLILAIALVASATAFETCGKKGAGSRIVNGLPAAHGEFPWQISLRHNSRHICGGTLIAPGWVLCASHCFGRDNNPSNFKIKVGDLRINGDDGSEKEIAVSKIIIHSGWNRRTRENDITLIKLDSEVDFSGPYIGSACLPNAGDDYHGATGCWVSGWGLTKPSGNFVRPNILQKLQGKIWTDSALKSRWGSMIRPGMIGFGTDRTSACMGDSGGPLVCPSKSRPGQFDVIGVVSWGSGRCQGQPGVFTEVAHFVPWIKANMQ